MFESDKTILQTENGVQLTNLGLDDQRVIRDIMKSMSIFKVNSYDAQVIQRDLIGMAFELKLRHSSLEEALGNDLKGFTQEIINNSGGPSKKEIIINFTLRLSSYFFVWFLLSAIVLYGRLSWDANPIIFLFYLGTVLIAFITEGVLAPSFITSKGLKKHMHSLISFSLMILLTAITFVTYDSSYTTTINGGMIIAASVLAYFLVKYLDSSNISKLATDKKNFISDLR